MSPSDTVVTVFPSDGTPADLEEAFDRVPDGGGPSLVGDLLSHGVRPGAVGSPSAGEGSDA